MIEGSGGDRARSKKPASKSSRERCGGGGPEGNERLTATSGFVLLLLLAVEGATLALRSLLSVHIFVGLLLIPPVAVKLASTGWRFVRYYSGNSSYRLRGPPQIVLRLLAPVLVAATMVLFGTGVALIVTGPASGFLLALHKASFLVWFILMVVHVLAYLGRVLRLFPADWRRGERSVAGTIVRRYTVGAAIVAGLVVGLATIPAQGPWLHWARMHHPLHHPSAFGAAPVRVGASAGGAIPRRRRGGGR